MSTFKKYRAGLHNVGSYQVAGLPYITGSSGMPKDTEERVIFPNVTKRVMVMLLMMVALASGRSTQN
jgi:hypothetical protein